jgi:hypothetical protein
MVARLLSVVVQPESDYHESMATLSTCRLRTIPKLCRLLQSLRRSPAGLRRRSRSLAHELVEGIGAQIQGQALKPGDKLPTESAIMQAYGVSRTVVREALSRLQAGGLVETRHGIGTFVLEPRPGQASASMPRTSPRRWM